MTIFRSNERLHITKIQAELQLTRLKKILTNSARLLSSVSESWLLVGRQTVPDRLITEPNSVLSGLPNKPEREFWILTIHLGTEQADSLNVEQRTFRPRPSYSVNLS